MRVYLSFGTTLHLHVQSCLQPYCLDISMLCLNPEPADGAALVDLQGRYLEGSCSSRVEAAVTVPEMTIQLQLTCNASCEYSVVLKFNVRV
jgi:hypothetical protein